MTTFGRGLGLMINSENKETAYTRDTGPHANPFFIGPMGLADPWPGEGRWHCKAFYILYMFCRLYYIRNRSVVFCIGIV